MVTDVNDNAPLIQNVPQQCVSISEFHEMTDTVMLVKAWDADDPATPNAQVTMRIEKGDDLGMYSSEQ